jgi:hypothetical protein
MSCTGPIAIVFPFLVWPRHLLVRGGDLPLFAPATVLPSHAADEVVSPRERSLARRLARIGPGLAPDWLSGEPRRAHTDDVLVDVLRVNCGILHC